MNFHMLGFSVCVDVYFKCCCCGTRGVGRHRKSLSHQAKKGPPSPASGIGFNRGKGDQRPCLAAALVQILENTGFCHRWTFDQQVFPFSCSLLASLSPFLKQHPSSGACVRLLHLAPRCTPFLGRVSFITAIEHMRSMMFPLPELPFCPFVSIHLFQGQQVLYLAASFILM